MQGDGDVGVPKMDDCSLGLPVRGHTFRFLENGRDFSPIVWVREYPTPPTCACGRLREGKDDETLV